MSGRTAAWIVAHGVEVNGGEEIPADTQSSQSSLTSSENTGSARTRTSTGRPTEVRIQIGTAGQTTITAGQTTIWISTTSRESSGVEAGMTLGGFSNGESHHPSQGDQTVRSATSPYYAAASQDPVSDGPRIRQWLQRHMVGDLDFSTRVTDIIQRGAFPRGYGVDQAYRDSILEWLILQALAEAKEGLATSHYHQLQTVWRTTEQNN